jgi:hypothetical protein|nr:MAG TPA: hypothetical protein [Caudoviricetes sp.]
MEKEKAKKIRNLLCKITYKLEQNEAAYSDIESLRRWEQNENIYITFHAEGWQEEDVCLDLSTSDLACIAKKSIEVINKRASQRRIEALGYAREIQEILTEVEEVTNE